MKKNLSLLGMMALVIGLSFFSISCKKGATPSEAPKGDQVPTSGIKLAYVEIDSLLTKYNLYKDVQKVLEGKSDGIRTTINQKGKVLENEAKEFQRKIETNAFTSQDAAEKENARLMRAKQELDQLQERLANDFGTEQQKQNLIIRDSINACIKAYNADKKYDMIFSNSGFSNILHANESLNITDQVLELLNSRYKPAVAAKK